MQSKGIRANPFITHYYKIKGAFCIPFRSPVLSASMKEQRSVLVFDQVFFWSTQANDVCANGWKQR